jgi:hypothetical protein
MHEDATAPVANPVIHPACARRGFVISPIGMEGSHEREHADDVFHYIIKPALEECGIVPERADHFHEPGLISLLENERELHVRALEAAGWPGTGLPGVSLRHPADRPCNVLPAAREFGVPERFSVRPATSPPLRRQRGTQLYSTFQRELDSLWDVNGGD